MQRGGNRCSGPWKKSWTGVRWLWHVPRFQHSSFPAETATRLYDAHFSTPVPCVCVCCSLRLHPAVIIVSFLFHFICLANVHFWVPWPSCTLLVSACTFRLLCPCTYVSLYYYFSIVFWLTLVFQVSRAPPRCPHLSVPHPHPLSTPHSLLTPHLCWHPTHCINPSSQPLTAVSTSQPQPVSFFFFFCFAFAYCCLSHSLVPHLHPHLLHLASMPLPRPFPTTLMSRPLCVASDACGHVEAPPVCAASTLPCTRYACTPSSYTLTSPLASGFDCFCLQY